MGQPYLFQGRMRFFIYLLAGVQLGLLALGAWQIQQPEPFTQGLGWLNIVTNIIGGAFNTKALQRRVGEG